MHFSRRFALTGAAAVVATVLCDGRARVLADGKLTEQNMTQKDYERLSKTESSVKDENPTEPPTPVHNLSEAGTRAVQDAHGAKVINGKDWKNETPQERDAHLRRIKETMPAGSKLIVTVPKGDVWLIPPGDDNKTYENLNRDNIIRPWTDEEKAGLAATVAMNTSNDQENRRSENRRERRRERKERP